MPTIKSRDKSPNKDWHTFVIQYSTNDVLINDDINGIRCKDILRICNGMYICCLNFDISKHTGSSSDNFLFLHTR